MNPPETQSDSSPHETYFDPEAMDTSEQEFSASLESTGEQPGFVLDSSRTSNSIGITGGSDFLENVERRASRPSATEIEACGATGVSPVQHDSATTDNGPPQSDWRDEVSAKVKRYKTLKPRKERYPSLQLQFDSVVPWKSEKSSFVAERDQFFASSPSAAPPPSFEPEPPISYPASTEATARVLEFPRPGNLPFNRDELAEPVNDRPRIVEAPEFLPPPPALGGILIEPTTEPEPEREPGVDMPLHTASLLRRVFAAAIDGLAVAGSTAIFGYMFLRFNNSLPQMRVAVEIAAGLTVALWFGYQSAFLIFCGTTPGLRATDLQITRFDGSPAPRGLRRWRVLASVLSFVSLGLGYAWSFLDEDQLSWHDRITRTHLAPRK